MGVERDKSVGSALSCVGARCCTTTSAIDSSVTSRTSAPNASRPPADAPMPTMNRAFLAPRPPWARVVAHGSSFGRCRRLLVSEAELCELMKKREEQELEQRVDF